MLGRTEEALAEARRAIDIQPFSFYGDYNLGLYPGASVRLGTGADARDCASPAELGLGTLRSRANL